MIGRSRALIALATVVAVCTAWQAVPRDSIINARTTHLAHQLRCPVCQGVSIQDSPSELAQQMRALVREQIVAGKTDEEVKAYFIGRYGEWILLSPKASGFNVLVYALPALALLVGAGLIVVVVRRWTSQTPDSSSAA